MVSYRDSSCRALVRSDQTWNIAATSALELLNPQCPALIEIKNRLRGLAANVLFSLSTSQACHYFHGKCSDKHHSLVLAAQSFTAKNRLAPSTELNRLHSLCIPLIEKAFHFKEFFPRTATFCNRHLHGCFFPKHYNLQTVHIRHFIQ